MAGIHLHMTCALLFRVLPPCDPLRVRLCDGRNLRLVKGKMVVVMKKGGVEDGTALPRQRLHLAPNYKVKAQAQFYENMPAM